MAKYIFVTGGVISSIGKGITVSSLGRLLRSRGISVFVQKLDPYLNVDPGTMSPYQHGEVFVTQDGAETDLDLGHYERFMDVNLTRSSNVTSGQIYTEIMLKERRGDFLGGTVQVVPHVTNEIKARITSAAKESGADVVLVEVGGTVGDIEGLPFLEAIRQLRKDVGRDNVLYVHLTYVPFIAPTGELKTKPTQHSVKELRSIGIQPDIIVCRSEQPLSDELKDKVALFCDVDARAVVPLPTVQSIYEVPLLLEEMGLGELLQEMLRLPAAVHDLHDWRCFVEEIRAPKPPVEIALVGKYVELRDAYLSVKEALCHAAVHHQREVKINWVPAEELERGDPDRLIRSAQGIVVPGGFGPRGVEGMILAARYARERRVPYLGLCLGMQVMTIEFARHVLQAPAHSTEFDADTPNPVIDILPEQRHVKQKGATMRLGLYPCNLLAGSRAARAYGAPVAAERHRHRFEFNNSYRETLEAAGLRATGLSPDGLLVEIVELADHPWMLGTQAHPEFTSRPNRPNPLFRDFIGAAKDVIREGGQHPLPLAAL